MPIGEAAILDKDLWGSSPPSFRWPRFRVFFTSGFFYTWGRRVVGARSRLAKAVAVAMPLAVLGGVLIKFGNADAAVVAGIKQYLGWPIDALNALCHLLRQPNLFQATHDFLLGPLLPETGAIVLVGYLVGGLRVPLPRRPLIDRLWPGAPDVLNIEFESPSAARDDPTSTLVPFRGRDELMMFAGPDESARMVWTILEGREGEGKTRLALEWLKKLRKRGWDAGFLLEGRTTSDAERAVLRRDTAIVVDEAGRLDRETLWAIVHVLLTKRAWLGREVRVRVLVVDQWVAAPPDSRPAGELKILGATRRDGFRLTPIDTATLAKISPELPVKTIEEADGRPLWVLLGEDPSAEIRRRADRRFARAGADEAVRRTLALAALAGPMPQAQRHLIAHTMGDIERQRALLEGEGAEVLRTILPGIRPEPLANEIILRWAENQAGEVAPFVTTATAARPDNVERRLLSLWHLDGLEPSREAARKDMQDAFDAAAPERVERLRAEAQAITNAAQTEGQTDAQLARLEFIATGRRFDPAMRFIEAWGAVDAILRYGIAKRFDDLERWGARLVALAETPPFSGDPAVRLQEAKGAFNGLCCYGAVKLFADLERWGARLVALAETPPFCDDPAVKRVAGKAAFHAIGYYGTAERFDDLERWGARLAALAENPSFSGDPAIRLLEAIGAFNGLNCYGAAERFDNLERWGARLVALAESPQFSGDLAIRLEEGKGAVNAIRHYGAAGRFGDLERWGTLLVALTETPPFASDPGIRLLEAMGAVNAINYYGKAEHIADLERWGARLVALAETPPFSGDPAIRLEEANGACNAISFYGAAKRFADLERWSARLVALAETRPFCGDPAFRLREARGIFIAIIWYGEAERFADLERWGTRLVALAKTPPFAHDPAVRLQEAKGASNAILYYGRTGSAQRNIWWNRLASVARDFPADAAIQEQAQDFDLAYAAQAAKGWPYGRPFE